MKSKVVEQYKKEPVSIYNKRFGIIFNGEDNLRDVVTENLIDSSPTALQCNNLYQSFLGGGGFEVEFDEVDVSEHFWETITPDDLLYEICEPIARHQGVFIHVQYNALYEKTSFKVFPYTRCKIGKKDSKNFAGKIVVSPNGWGKNLKADEVQVYDTYNPRPSVIQTQVDRDGGWENYNGQILYFKLSNKYDYAKPLIESSYLFADVEHKMGNFFNTTVSRGFNDLVIVRHRAFENTNDENKLKSDLKEVTGVENASSVLIIQDDWEDDSESKEQGNIRFDKISSDQKPDRYLHFETSSANFIRKAYRGVPPQLVDYIAGKLGGSSGGDIIEAQKVYNKLTAQDRSKIEKLFKELFWNFHEDINPSNNWKIKQFSLIDETTD